MHRSTAAATTPHRARVDNNGRKPQIVDHVRQPAAQAPSVDASERLNGWEIVSLSDRVRGRGWPKVGAEDLDAIPVAQVGARARIVTRWHES